MNITTFLTISIMSLISLEAFWIIKLRMGQIHLTWKWAPIQASDKEILICFIATLLLDVLSRERVKIFCVTS